MARRRRAQEENGGVVGSPYDESFETFGGPQIAVAQYDTDKWTPAQLDEQVLGPMIAKLAAGPS